jgi:dTDP-glucose 4,6-dehydratase
VAELAKIVLAVTGSDSVVEYYPLPQDDPARRKPVIDIATEKLGWIPSVPLDEGVRRTVEWFRSRPAELEVAAAALAGGQLDGAVIAPRP